MLAVISSIKLIQKIDDNLKAIYGFISGTMLLSEEIRKLAAQLTQQQVQNYKLILLKQKLRKYSKYFHFIRHLELGKINGKDLRILLFI